MSCTLHDSYPRRNEDTTGNLQSPLLKRIVGKPAANGRTWRWQELVVILQHGRKFAGRWWRTPHLAGASAVLIALFTGRHSEGRASARRRQRCREQIQMLVEASRSVAPAILDHTGAYVTPPNTTGFRSLLAYTDEAFPRLRRV